MNNKLFLVLALIPCDVDCKDESKIQSRASQKYSANWDGIFGKKEPSFKPKRPHEINYDGSGRLPNVLN